MDIKKSSSFLYQSLLGIAVGAACLAIPGTAMAQVGLAPMVIETESQRGRARGVLTVVNTGSEPKRMRAFTEPFTFDSETGFQSLAADASDLSPYLRFSPREFVIPPGGKQRIRIMSTMPASLEAGEYRAIILTEEVRDISEQSGVVINARVGSMMYVRHGETQPALSITGSEWDKEKGQLELQVGNDGNASVRPQTEWELKQKDKTISSGLVQPKTVIAGSDRTIPIKLESSENFDLQPGRYDLFGSFIWADSGKPNSQRFQTSIVID